MILHITTQMELIKLDKSIELKRQTDGKITLWQLARIYIYTLPFATLDMILKNAIFQLDIIWFEISINMNYIYNEIMISTMSLKFNF